MEKFQKCRYSAEFKVQKQRTQSIEQKAKDESLKFKGCKFLKTSLLLGWGKAGLGFQRAKSNDFVSSILDLSILKKQVPNH